MAEFLEYFVLPQHSIPLNCWPVYSLPGGQIGGFVYDEEFERPLTYDAHIMLLKREDEDIVAFLIALAQTGVLNQWR